MLTDWFEPHDQRFHAHVLPNVHVEKPWTGGRWPEGPVYVAAGLYVLFSDIPNDRVMRWDETDGSVSIFAHSCGFHNGHTLDSEGRVLACEHAGRRISRWEYDGSTTTIASNFDGRRLNSPNDFVVKSDGSIWFTDPTYGIDTNCEGHQAPSEIGASNVYRIDPTTGAMTVVAADFVQPNGLAFNEDETSLYVVDSGATHVENGPRHIRVIDVNDDGRTQDQDSGGDGECRLRRP
jgi:gluconolactonase